MKKRPSPYKHQAKALKLSKDKKAFAFLMEMGTGKTRPIIDTADYLHKHGKIEALVVLAPNGVQRNWILNEMPKWCTCDYRATYWRSNPNKKQQAELEAVVGRPYSGLRVIAANYESITSLKFKVFLRKFLKSFPSLMVLDESTRIKTPASARTKYVIGTRQLPKYRRILSGLVTPNSPFDAYKQFQFLDPDILGFGSFYAFKAHFAEMETNPRLLAAIQKKSSGGTLAALRGTPAYMLAPTGGVVRMIAAIGDFVSQGQLVGWIDEKYEIFSTHAGTVTKVYKVQEYVPGGEKVLKLIQAPMLIQRDATGLPKYKNLDQLAKLIEPHSYRVLKSECLDLPEKVYNTLPVELTKKQRAAYDLVAEEIVAEFDEGSITNTIKIAQMTRLQQITGGFWVLDGEKVKPIDGEYPKLDAIMDHIEDTTGKVAIWTHYQHENELIAARLREEFGDSSVVQYYGKVPQRKKDLAVDRFSDIVRDAKGHAIKSDTGAKYWVGEPGSGGIGIELILAENVYYYSNSFNLEHRLQSEDRHHRSGTRHTVTYNDVEAMDSMDQKLIGSLRNKLDVSTIIMNDNPRNWI